MTEERTDSIEYLVEQATRYYNLLRERGIPEALAVRIVGDWHNGCVTVALNYFHGRLKTGSSALTRQMGRVSE